MDCSAFTELQTSSKRRPSPVYSALRAAGPRHWQNSHASRKGRAGDPWGSSVGNTLIRGQQKLVVAEIFSIVLLTHCLAPTQDQDELEARVKDDSLPYYQYCLGCMHNSQSPLPEKLAQQASKTGFHMLARLVLNYRPQMIHPPLSPTVLGLQVAQNGQGRWEEMENHQNWLSWGHAVSQHHRLLERETANLSLEGMKACAAEV
ncbi:hypothetical protein AAY473_031463 [Plecturocebus cupreus]